MATFTGTHAGSYTVNAAPEAAAAHFADLDAIAAAIDGLVKAEKLAADTLKITLAEQKQGPYTFQPTFTLQVRCAGASTTWTTIDGNMKNDGRVDCSAAGDATSVAFTETIELELPIPRLAVRVVQPVVDRSIRPGIEAYAKAMVAGI